MGRRDWAEMVVIWLGTELNLGIGFFRGQVQRRGTHVSTPKIGSRGDVFCFGGILGFHADLRREIKRGNFKWGFFWGLLVVPRGATEEGGQLVFLLGNVGF
jgi:hypothetical protein